MHTRSSNHTDMALARKYDLPTLTGALIGRLTLDGRVADALQLGRLFTETNIGTGGSEVDTSLALAHEHGTGALAGALVSRLTLDGRVDDADKLAILFKLTKIGTAGFGRATEVARA